MKHLRRAAVGIVTAVVALLGLVAPTGSASAAVHPGITCGGRGLCMFTGTYFAGTETFIQGNVPNLGAIGASTVRSAIMGGNGNYWDCWYLYTGASYTGSVTVVRDGDHYYTMPAGRTSFQSARYYSAC